MGFLQNTWVRYYDRSFTQIKDHVVTDLQGRVPEITDHTEMNIYIKMLSVWSAIAEMLGYYIDNAGREAHLDSCRLYSSGISIARRADYRVRGKLAANGDVVFTLSGVQTAIVSIPAGTIVKSNLTGNSYTTIANVFIPIGQLTASVGVLQYLKVTNLTLAPGTGLADQEVIVGTDVMDSTVGLTVDGDIWTRKETLAFSIPDSKHFVETVDANYNHVIRFGDGINGVKPIAGAELVVSYQSTEGDTGGAEALEVDTVVSTFVLTGGVTLGVSNPAPIVGGSDVESLDQIKTRLPKLNRTKDRAVTDQDHIDIATLAPGVAKAGLIFNCGQTIDIYIVPDGGGVASTPLLTSTLNYFATRKLTGKNVVIKPAGEIRIHFNITVNALPQYTNAAVYNNVIANLTAFASYLFQDINGSMSLGDVYQIVENTEGVKNSQIDVMTPVPYARPLDENVTVLNWDKVVKSGSTATAEWKIIFVSTTHYQLLKNNGYLGEFVVGSQVQQPELDFTINANAVNGDSWEFFTYPYFGSIQLREPSLPVSYAEDINLTVTGGL